MNFKKNESTTKLRGGYYTPEKIARFLARWIVENKPETILEPSCGDGVFVRALDGLHDYDICFTGVEIEKVEADKAAEVSSENKFLHATIENMDFLEFALDEMKNGGVYQAVRGLPRNPACGREKRNSVSVSFVLDSEKKTFCLVRRLVSSPKKRAKILES